MRIRRIIRLEITLIVKTGLTIGAKDVLDVSSLDIQLMKDAYGRPYIPGSSLKGRMRFLLEKFYDEDKVEEYFGPKPKSNKSALTKIFFEDLFPVKIATEVKAENTINRATGKAENPREIERIAPGSIFKGAVEILEYEGSSAKEAIKMLLIGFKLLELLGLGRSVSRGYGRVQIKVERAIEYRIEDGKLIERGCSILEGDIVCS